jgi:hypothetical protein
MHRTIALSITFALSLLAAPFALHGYQLFGHT